MKPSIREYGAQVELKFELRLRELGYAPICVPCRIDDGVDFAVFTSRGWVGIQVRGSRKQESLVLGASRKRTHNSHPDRYARIPLTSGHWKQGRKDYYEQRGVSVVAWYFNGGFLLIPLGDFNMSGISYRAAKHRWEAWAEVVGVPVTLESISSIETEPDQLEVLWDKS